MTKSLLASSFVFASATLFAPAATTAQTTAQAQPGFNLFTVQQDIEIGQQSAAEAEKQLVLLGSADANQYLNRIVQRLAAAAPGARYPYHIKAVNAAEINAFALPGGPMYVNRGLLEAARSEAELAGVLAHEMSHVALRHGTHQASKAYLSQAGLSILGGLLGQTSSAAKIVNAIGGIGLNAAFLKFSRDDEYQADQTGAMIMAKAGYDPLAMATMFELLRAEEGRDPSKVEQFFSNHPPTADREARIRTQAAGLRRGATELVGGFDAMRSGVRGLPASSASHATTIANAPRRDTTVYAGVPARIEAPSTRFQRFAQPNQFFALSYPVNWHSYPSGLALSIAPNGGVVSATNGQQSIVYGVIVNHYSPFENTGGAKVTLEAATEDLIQAIRRANPYLAPTGSRRALNVGGGRGLSVRLSGRSPVTRETEQVIAYTRGLSDGHVIYVLGVAPEQANGFDQTFARMIRSLRVNDRVAHRPTR